MKNIALCMFESEERQEFPIIRTKVNYEFEKFTVT